VDEAADAAGQHLAERPGLAVAPHQRVEVVLGRLVVGGADAEVSGGETVVSLFRRIEPSSSFITQFGYPSDTVVTLDHFLGPVLPIGRKMTRPMSLSNRDKNGVAHECATEAFDTTHNVLILLYPLGALTATTIILPASMQGNGGT
jgi:hypothetical protein